MTAARKKQVKYIAIGAVVLLLVMKFVGGVAEYFGFRKVRGGGMGSGGKNPKAGGRRRTPLAVAA